MAQQINRPATAFSLDPSRKGQKGRIEDARHLSFIRTLPCLACGATPPRTEAAHLRYGDPDFAKPKTPMGRKPDDCWSVPLCAYCHREGPDAQHRSNERVWWEARSIVVLDVARRLYAASGDRDAALAIIHSSGGGSAPWTR